MSRPGLVLGVACGAVAGPVGVMQAVAAPLTCGQTITTNVTLTQDLTCAGNAFTIGASNVTVDLAGHSIISNGTGGAFRIVGPTFNLPFTNITVRNGTLSRFAVGFEIDSANSINLERLRLINVGGSSATAAALHMQDGARAVRFDHGVIQNNNANIAVVRDSAGLTISHSRISGGRISFLNSRSGDMISDSRLTDVSIGSNMTDNLLFTRDILLRSPIGLMDSFRVTLRNNRLSGADIALILGTRTQWTKVTHNVFSDNRVGVALLPAGTLTEVHDTDISNNIFSRNGAAGAWLEGTGGAQPNAITVIGNRFHSNGHNSGGLLDRFGNTVDDGLHIDAPGASGVTVTENRTDHNADYGIEVQPGTVTDGGGNVSHHDPHGCLGVVCAP